MIIPYEYFTHLMNSRIKSDQQFYNELLITVLQNPNRYTGIFRLSNAKTKLLQNVTQSREIKFGDFMEEIVTEYLGRIGYTNLDKNIGFDEERNSLSADQVFTKDNTVYLIEQKIRDDHDSTKKRGQFANFKKKYECLQRSYPDKQINATMWFIDPSLVKNKSYYTEEINKETLANLTLNICYGGSLFDDVIGYPEVWNEICTYLSRHKDSRKEEILTIPDFDTSDEMYQALQNLLYLEKLSVQQIKQLGYKGSVRGLYKKLNSERPEYVQLRKELFSTGKNLNKLKQYLS